MGSMISYGRSGVLLYCGLLLNKSSTILRMYYLNTKV